MRRVPFLISALLSLALCAFARRVVVFGATGKTGQRVVSSLVATYPDCEIVCAVRSLSKARSIIGPDTMSLSVLPCDVVKDSPAKVASIVKGADACVCAFGNSNPSLSGAFDVDYKGTIKTIDACIDAGVPKYVMVSSLLTNGLQAGQLFNPQFLLLNAFGGVLAWKRQAELYLEKQSAMKYTVVRPGGLTDNAPSSPVLYGSQDTLFGGSISRQQVGKVVAEACFLHEADNKIVEIIATADAEILTEQEGFQCV